ncbi:MAG: dihydroneopterin aldolase [Kiritimatiellae bacterium]|nr:dihydroneopterin aldolase [Kiritimatiellia bacterium]
MDSLRLNGIEVLCIIGDLPEERLREQRLLVDATLELDLSAAAASDSLADTVDYAALSRRIRETLRSAKCRLVERAAKLAVGECLADARVVRATVSVRKCGSVPGLSSAEVAVSRMRGEAAEAIVNGQDKEMCR